MSKDKPHILVTNDDGIDSFFLKVLVEGLAAAFRVTVAAPMGEQSWIGRAMSRNRDVHMAVVEGFPGKAYALDGTPSDCVNIALGHLVKDDPVLAVCSGINIGFNIGTPLILSSGTVAGAIEGAGWGLPALAFSHHVADEEYEHLRKNHGQGSAALKASLRAAAAHACRMTGDFLGEKPNKTRVHNINFPSATAAATPVEKTEPWPVRLRGLFEQDTPVSYRFRYPSDVTLPTEGPSDMACLLRGSISHSILEVDRIGQL